MATGGHILHESGHYSNVNNTLIDICYLINGEQWLSSLIIKIIYQMAISQRKSNKIYLHSTCDTLPQPQLNSNGQHNKITKDVNTSLREMPFQLKEYWF